MYVIVIITIFARLKEKLSLAHFFECCPAAHEFHDLIGKRVNVVDEVYQRPLWRHRFIIEVFLKQMIVHGCKGAKFV